MWWLWASAAMGADLVSAEGMTGVRQALALVGVDEADLAYDKDYVNGDGVARDRWRLPGAAALLHEPLRVPADAQALTDAVLAAGADPVAQVLAGAAALGEEVAQPVPVTWGGPPPKKRDARGLGPDLAVLVADAERALAAIEGAAGGALPRGTEGLAASRADDLVPDDAADESPVEQQRLREFRALAMGDAVDWPVLLGAGRDAAALAVAVEERAAAIPADQWPAAPVRVGRVLVGSRGNDVLSGEGLVLVLDPGGDDLDRAGRAPLVSITVDLGGDDVHAPRAAGAVRGIAVAIDTKGDDVWPAGVVGGGAAVFGVGVALDREGDDTWEGDAMVQGAADNGIGLLLDVAGMDRYLAGARAQGAAAVRGYGMLWEGGGHDTYQLGGQYADSPDRYAERTLSLGQGFAIGARPWAGGGTGVLVDAGGNDAYVADLFAQGCSYWFARGYLVDLGGNDSYRAFQYGQGSGIHLSTGGLFDLAGDDDYMLGNLGQGSSHDYAVGWLVDRAGSDVYAGRTTLQGGSLTNAVTFFLDEGGDDTYSARTSNTSRGAGNLNRDMGAIGIYVDLGGEDHRDAPGPAEGTWRRPWTYGVALDVGADALPPPPAPVAVPPLPPLREAPPDDWGFDLLDDAAADAWLAARPDAALAEELRRMSRYAVKPADADAARAVAAKEGVPAFERLLPLVWRDELMEGYALQELFSAVRAEHPDADAALDALLVGAASAPEGGGSDLPRRWLLRWLRMLPDVSEAGVGAIVDMAGSPDPMTRSEVARTLGGLKRDPPGVLDRLAADPHESVRAVAAWALGEVHASPERIVPLLGDPSILVRGDAARVLSDRPDARKAVVAAWGTMERRRQHLDLLVALGEDRLVKRIAAGDPDPWVRLQAQRLLADGPPPWVAE